MRNVTNITCDACMKVKNVTNVENNFLKKNVNYNNNLGNLFGNGKCTLKFYYLPNYCHSLYFPSYVILRYKLIM